MLVAANEVFYTGVGSRETPDEIQMWMRAIAELLGRAGWTLRSGAAEGADRAFESGCDLVRGLKDIYLPWKGYNGHPSDQCDVGRLAMQLAQEIHPAWHKLSDASRRLHARNVYQVIGREMDTPSKVLICWTPDGCEGLATRTKKTGGTGTAILVAERFGVPVFNLAREDSYDRLVAWLRQNNFEL